MDLNRLPHNKQLELCRWYFRAGFAFLPFAWAVNAIWFGNLAFASNPFTEQEQMKKYVIMSAIGSALWLIVLIVWVVLFQVYRVEWGDVGETLSFITPLGRA